MTLPPRNSATPNFDTGELETPLQDSLSLLLQARQYAGRADVDIWQFALEIAELRRNGTTSSDLRLLLAQGFVEHAREITHSTDTQRRFQGLTRFSLGPDVCFVMTDAGIEFAQANGRDSSERTPDIRTDVSRELDVPWPGSQSGFVNGHTVAGKPVWDGDRRELRLGPAIVKLFKWPAANQEVVLAVFEEEGWPFRIDDPLPMAVNLEPRRRLHDTIKCLNRRQRRPLIHFRGDGTGEGVVWELASSEP